MNRVVTSVWTVMLAVMSGAAPVAVFAAGKELWLFGGGEPICSSVELKRCDPAKRAQAEAGFRAANAVMEKNFRVTAERLATLENLNAWPGSGARRLQVLDVLKKNLAVLSGKDWPETAWIEQWSALQLGDDEQNLLDDVFEQRPVDARGATRQIKVDFAATPVFVQTMFRALVDSARTRAANPAQKPKLVLITASSNSPYEWVDYYRQVFAGAGAEVVWLPLEPALAQGVACAELDAGRFRWNGQFARAARYPELAAEQRSLCEAPEKMLALIAEADAFFINGGDQSLTMRAFTNAQGEINAFAKAIHARVQAGAPLAGSSAGTAVQTGPKAGPKTGPQSGPQTGTQSTAAAGVAASRARPMITGGRSTPALREGAQADVPDAPLCALHGRCTSTAKDGQLTYRSEGGLGVFTLGVSDTHFRERDREGRLLRLLMDTHTDAGFGVDEATVLRANFHSENAADLQVMGPGGVWIVDTRDATVRSNATMWSASGFRVSRLLAGDRVHWREGVQTADLACAPQRLDTDAARQLDAGAYLNVQGRTWTVLPTDTPLRACARQDGRWRYVDVPMALHVRH